MASLLKLITFLLVITFPCSGFKCGPEQRCYCTDDESVSMDCSARQITLRQTCDVIGNMSKNVRHLNIGRNNLGRIDNGDLDGCEHVKRLNLEYNQISKISEQAFQSMTNLTELSLRWNALSIYTKHTRTTFIPPSVETLCIDGNMNLYKSMQVANVSYPNISHLENLKSLYIDGIDGVDFDQSYRNLGIKHISFSGLIKYKNCTINVITNTTLSNLFTVTHLNISGCHITNIHAGAFQQLSHLHTLDLSDNRQLGFRMLNNISYSLQFTNITVFNYSRVYPVYGNGNTLYKRDVCYLYNTTIEELVMDQNRLEFIETNTLILLPPNAKYLSAKWNKFTFNPYLLQLGCLSKTHVLNIVSQNAAIPPFKYFFQMGDEPEASHSRCPFLSESWLKNRSKSNLFQNCTYFAPGQFTLKQSIVPLHLEDIHLYNSNLNYKITSPTDIYPHNNCISYVDVSGNVLSSLTGAVSNLYKLETLNLSRNYIEEINAQFLNFEMLATLRLDVNILGKLLANCDRANIFDNVPNAKVLNLSSNSITTICSRTFERLTNLEHLDLSINNIEEFTLNLANMKNLTTLDLHMNSIHSLDSATCMYLERNSKHTRLSFSVDMRNNSILYSCHNLEFLQWILKHNDNFVGFESYRFVADNGTCISAQEFMNYLPQLPANCTSYTTLIVVCSIGVSVFLSVIIGGILYRNKWKLRYLLYMSRKRFYGYHRLNSEDIVENYRYDAFISYADTNLRFVLDFVIPELEVKGLSLCIHQRDFMPGNAISDNIINAIQSSRKTVALISAEFLSSKWCVYEFNMARMESFYSRGDDGCLVVALLEDISLDRMSGEMVEWLRQNSYIEFTTDPDGQRLFWNNISTAIRPETLNA